MSNRSQWVVGLLLVLGLVGAVTAVLIRRPPRDTQSSGAGQGQSPVVPTTPPHDSPAGAAQAGFHDEGPEAGIHFRMQFLPGEQGEQFKINLYDHGCGVAAADYDGDGWDDLYFLNQLGPNALYRNRGDGTFEDVTEEAGPVGLDDRICVGAAWGDYDTDGDQDLYVTSTRGGNALFRNDGQGGFQEVTKAAGLTHVGHSQTAAFFDCDSDADLDLLVLNSAQWTTDEFNAEQGYYAGVSTVAEVWESPKEYNLLYRNNGDGTFSDESVSTGLKGLGYAGDLAVFDCDEDGRIDVLITSMFNREQLYRNEGDGTFRDIAIPALQRIPFGATGTKCFDFNNDGRLDLYVVDMHSDMWMDWSYDLSRVFETTKYGSPFGPGAREEQILVKFDSLGLDITSSIFGNGLYKNLGDGQFEELSDPANMETFWPWGLATGDFDNDGYEDVFVAAGMGYPFGYWPNSLMMNNGDGTFTNAAKKYGIDPPRGGIHREERIGGKPAARSSRCAATADFDGDGRLDLVVSNFNDRPYYLRNQFPPKNFVSFHLTGTKSNRDAIGALVRLYFGSEVMVRQVHAAGGYLSQCSKTLHFGLGDRERIDRAEIHWPGQEVQTIEHPAINQRHDVKQE